MDRFTDDFLKFEIVNRKREFIEDIYPQEWIAEEYNARNIKKNKQ